MLPRRATDIVLRVNAVFDLAVGVVLISATEANLYRSLDLPHPEPELFTQLAGAVLIGFAFLLWVAPVDLVVARAAALAAAIGNALGAVVLLAWLTIGETSAGALGLALLWIGTVALAAFAVLEGLIVASPLSGGRSDRKE